MSPKFQNYSFAQYFPREWFKLYDLTNEIRQGNCTKEIPSQIGFCADGHAATKKGDEDQNEKAGRLTWQWPWWEEDLLAIKLVFLLVWIGISYHCCFRITSPAKEEVGEPVGVCLTLIVLIDSRLSRGDQTAPGFGSSRRIIITVTTWSTVLPTGSTVVIFLPLVVPIHPLDTIPR